MQFAKNRGGTKKVQGVLIQDTKTWASALGAVPHQNSVGGASPKKAPISYTCNSYET